MPIPARAGRSFLQGLRGIADELTSQIGDIAGHPREGSAALREVIAKLLEWAIRRQSVWIEQVQRVIADIGIKIDAGRGPGGIDLQEAAEHR